MRGERTRCGGRAGLKRRVGSAERMAARQRVPRLRAGKECRASSQPHGLLSRPSSRGACEPFRGTPQSSSEPAAANAACSMTDPRSLPPRRVTTTPRTACNAAATIAAASSTRPASVATSFPRSIIWALNALRSSRCRRSRASMRLFVSSKRLSIRRLLSSKRRLMSSKRLSIRRLLSSKRRLTLVEAPVDVVEALVDQLHVRPSLHSQCNAHS